MIKITNKQTILMAGAAGKVGGGAFPLVYVDMVIGVMNCSGKLSMVIEYAEEATDAVTMEKIKDKALTFLVRG